MILAAALLFSAVVIGRWAPRYLQITVAPGLSPRLAMAAWLGSVGVFSTALVAVPAALFLRPGRDFLSAASVCVGRIQNGRALPWLESTQVVLSLVLAAGLAHVLVVLARRLRRHRRWSAEHLRMLRLLGEPPMDAEVHFLTPVPLTPDARRRMADLAHERIAAALADRAA